MSVIINSTTINFDNNTDYLIQIVIEAEQDDSFHVKSSSDIILQNTKIIKCNDKIYHHRVVLCPLE